MLTRRFPLLLIILFFAACSQPEHHWINASGLLPSDDANIVQMELKDGSTILFDQALGWYNPERQFVEGLTITGWHDTTPVSKIQRMEIVEKPNGDNTTWKAIGYIALAAVAVSLFLLIALGRTFSNAGGCLVLMAVLGVGIAAAIVILV